MSLIKKTIILLKNTPCGYVTVVRVGDETGAKIVGDDLRKGYTAYLKIGSNIMTAEIEGKRSEISVGIPFNTVDDIGCAIYDKTKIIAKGGKDISEREISLLNGKTDESAAQSDVQIVPEEKREEVSEETEVMESGSETENENPPEDAVINEENTTVSEETNETESIEQETSAPNEETLNPTDFSDIIRDSDTVSEEQEMLNRLSQGKTDFYIGISDKVDEMFVVYPKEEKLSSVIPDSEWVKINYDGDDYYVVGRLKDNGKVKYLGYGVPGVEGVRPPKIADDITNWFPLALDGYDGYWLFFQDAETGKID